MIVVNAQISGGLGEVLGPEDMMALQHNPVSAQYFPEYTLEKIKTIYATAFRDDIKVLIGASAIGLVASLFAFEPNPPPMPRHRPLKDPLGNRLGQSETELDEMTRYR